MNIRRQLYLREQYIIKVLVVLVVIAILIIIRRITKLIILIYDTMYARFKC